MTTILIVLLLGLGWVVFVLAVPDRACRKCGGWGQKTRRRRNRACPKCMGTGRHFRLGAPLVYRGKSLVIRHARERRERAREAKEKAGYPE